MSEFLLCPRAKAVLPLKRIRLCALLLCFSLGVTGGMGTVLAEGNPQPVNLPGEIAARIAQCWTPPRMDPGQILEVTVRLAFSRTGAVIGEPRVAYIRAPAQAGLHEKTAASVLAAIRACTPLPFTASLGAAIAGRILAIHIRSLPLSGRPRLT